LNYCRAIARCATYYQSTPKAMKFCQTVSIREILLEGHWTSSMLSLGLARVASA
jgi:hypothetical protein